MERFRKLWASAVSAFITLFVLAGPVFADITNPLAGKSGSVDGVVNSFLKWTLGTVAAVAGAVFMIFLYLAIGNWMAGANHAQKRAEAKTQFIYVLISGILLGACGTIAGALFNFGKGLGA